MWRRACFETAINRQSTTVPHACLRSDGVQLRWQVAVAPLRQQPPDWTAFAAEAASLLLAPQPCAGAAQLPDQLRLALMDAGRRLAVAAGARLGSPAQQCMALPEPVVALTAMQGEGRLRVCDPAPAIARISAI